jgi:hypothetical protein
MRTRSKIVLTIAIAILTWWAFDRLDPSPPIDPKPLNVRGISSRELLEEYKDLNSDYFDDHLTHDVVIRKAHNLTLNGERIMASTECDETKRCLILIDVETNVTPDTTTMSLYHEACHVATYSQELNAHGAKWQSCMQDLAALGAFKDVW